MIVLMIRRVNKKRATYCTCTTIMIKNEERTYMYVSSATKSSIINNKCTIMIKNEERLQQRSQVESLALY